MPQDQALARITATLDKEAASGRFSGAVLIAKNGKAILEKAYGLADSSSRIPNQISTEFNLGSNNKLFTSVAILQLVEAGKVKLSDTIGCYLKDYPVRQVATRVTIQELLTHRGATGDFFTPEYEAHRLELRTHSDYIKRFAKLGLQGEPGGKPVYSNFGYILLGAIIEKVSGEDYYRYVQDHILAPAGMKSTGFPLGSEHQPYRAIGYTESGGALKPNDDTLPYRGTSAGGGYSTVEDQLRFLNALQDHWLISAHSLHLLITGEPVTPGGPAFPLGMGSTRVNGVRYYCHAGGAPGISSEIEFSPESGYAIVVLANRDPMLATVTAQSLRQLLPRH